MKSLIFTLLFIFSLSLSFENYAQTTFYRHADKPLLQPGPAGSFEEWDVSHPRVLFDGKKYHMWYTAMNYTYHRSLGYAVSDDGLNWKKYPGNPVLSPGSEGEWDDYGPEVPAVLYDKKEGIFKMWYMGANEPYGVIGSGYAWSEDGIHWTKYENNPVLPIGAPGEWDDGDAALETVIFDGETYHGWYTGFRVNSGWNAHIGYATSPDGIHWTKYAGNPVLSPTPGTWNEAGIWVSSVVLKNEVFHMFYDGGNYLGDNSIAYATSTDGANWTPYEDNPIYHASENGFDDFWVLTPWVLYMNNEWKMWYTALSSSWVQSMGYASSKKAPGLIKHLKSLADQNRIESINPNPVTDNTMITIKLEEAGHVLMTITTQNGTLIEQFVNRYYETGTYDISYNASGLKPGIYLCNLSMKNYKETKLLVVE